MNISQEFTVARSAAEVYDFFQDVAAVASCLPGAELTADHGDGRYEGTVSVALGPMTATFEGKATYETDAAERSGTISGTGVDRRGGSRGKVSVVYSIAGAASNATVSVDADVVLSGPAAQFGRSGLINQISERLIGEFVSCVEAKLAADSPEAAAEVEAAPVRGLSLFFSSLGSALARFFKSLFGRR